LKNVIYVLFPIKHIEACWRSRRFKTW